MSGRDLELDRVELDDAEAPWALPTGPTPIDTAERRLEAWGRACSGGAANVLTVAGVSYSWDVHPRRLKNGAIEGRVYAQARGELARDIGGYKIGGDGAVLRVPAELAGLLPGAATAAQETA